MIKPSAVGRGVSGAILAQITDNGFRIKALKMTTLCKAEAERFYEIHRERPFFASLVEFMSSGPIVAAVLEKENAVAAFRDLIGATDPSKAAPGTIRQLFGTNVTENAIHGSDSDENALREASFFFSERERF